MQHADGGWGEDGKSYYKNFESFSKASTPSQTSWALMALHAAGEIRSENFYKGVNYLLKIIIILMRIIIQLLDFQKFFILSTTVTQNIFHYLLCLKSKIKFQKIQLSQLMVSNQENVLVIFGLKREYNTLSSKKNLKKIFGFAKKSLENLKKTNLSKIDTVINIGYCGSIDPVIKSGEIIRVKNVLNESGKKNPMYRE